MSATRMMGVETEYAVTGQSIGGQAVTLAPLVGAMFMIAEKNLVHLPDPRVQGMFLGNGARFYNDQSHPEYSTPECDNPWDVVRYTLAGDRLVLDLAGQVAETMDEAEVVPVFKGNIDYSNGDTSWGCHESYQHSTTVTMLQRHLIPHLVTRIIFTGAGGFNSRSAGLEFMVSPRVAHLEMAISNSSTESRGIFHTKDEPLNQAGFSRLHLLCGESNASHLSSVLKIGTTALIVCLIESRVRPVEGITLSDPLAAMAEISIDPTCQTKVPILDGQDISALEIQFHYLQQVKANIDQPFMPEWAESICSLWEEALNNLANNAACLQKRLDWKIKHAVYGNFLLSKSFDWEEVKCWNQFLKNVEFLEEDFLDGLEPRPTEALLDPPSSLGPLTDHLHEQLIQASLSPVRYLRFLQLREEMLELDTKFMQLGDGGVFTSLDKGGVIDHRVTGVDNIEAALNDPPSQGRAHARGMAIKDLSGKNGVFRAAWDSVIDLENRRILFLKDPLATEATWTALPEDDPAPRARHNRPRTLQPTFLTLLQQRGF